MLRRRRFTIIFAPETLQALLERSRESIGAGKGLSSRDFWKVAAERHPQTEARKREAPNQSGPANIRRKRSRD